MTYREVPIPPALRALQKPWFGTRHDLLAETLVRAGARIIQNDGRFQITRGAHGTTAVREDIPIETIARFIAMCRREYLQPSKRLETALRAYEKLDTYLRQRSLSLSLGHEFRGDEGIAKVGDALGITDTIIRILPDKHLCGGDLKAIQLGGYGRHGSDYFEYTHGKLHMLTPSLTGPKRNYMALLLRGMGETYYLQLHGQDVERMYRIHTATSHARFGVDYLQGERSRIEDQGTFEVFVTENYMHYVSQGKRLDTFICSLGAKERTAWHELMRTYAKNFDGIAYVDAE